MQSRWLIGALVFAAALTAGLSRAQALGSQCLGEDAAWDQTGAEGSSRRCIGCHDGSVAGTIPHRGSFPGQAGDGDESNGFSLGESHPVGVSYFAALARQRTALNPTVDPRLALPRGQVECITCHTRGSALPARLAISNDGSTLCLSCHKM